MGTRNHKRALKVIRQLRSHQETQGRKIDILCSDMVSAHIQFAQKQSRMNFAVSFYESVLGCADRQSVLDAAIRCIEANVLDSGCAIFLLAEEGFSLHGAENGGHYEIETSHLQDWFSPPLVDQISQMNRVCTLEQLMRMGLQGPPAMLKTISAAAVPLGRFGHGLGFMFIYRHAEHPISAEELSRVAAVSAGLREAIGRFRQSEFDINTADSSQSGI